MFARLNVVGGSKTKRIKLHLPAIIGRGGESKVKLPASTVSRQHCEVYEYEGQLAVRDLGSSNGTVVNGHCIDGPTFVNPEDVICVGPLVFQLELLETSKPAAAAEENAARKGDGRKRTACRRVSRRRCGSPVVRRIANRNSNSGNGGSRH